MKDLTWLKESLIAHRGLHTSDKTVVENSKTSFINAIKNNYAIECDLNVLKDGTVVVFHDKDLKRLCNDDRLLKDCLYSDIKDLKLLNSNDTIMTLEELLLLVDGKVPLLIELKPFGDYKLLSERTYTILRHYHYPCAIFSFHPKIVYWFKKNANNIIRGQISSLFKNDKNMSSISKKLLGNMVFNRFTKPDFISYQIDDLPNSILDKYKKKGITIISYAARNQNDFDMVKKHYDNVVFEYFKPNKV